VKQCRENKGVITILVAGILVPFILLFLVVGADFAYMYYVRGELQNAADSAALAGAAKLTGAKDEVLDPIAKKYHYEQPEARLTAWQFACKNKAAHDPVFLVISGPDCNNPSGDLNKSNSADGDIVVGYWKVTPFACASTGQTEKFCPANGSTGFPINAVKVVTRRTGDAAQSGIKIGNNPVGLLFGKLVNWPFMSAKASAIASGGGNLLPLSVIEYWMGDSGLGSCPPTNYDPTRSPYDVEHIYPNSFVRPPCLIVGASNCTSPSNGNVSLFPPATQTCGTPSATPVLPNGPLTLPCVGTDCRGRPTSTSGRVFAIVGGNANSNNSGEIAGLVDLDQRNPCSEIAGCPNNQWFQVSGSMFTPIPNAGANPDKSVAIGYIVAGVYPNIQPISVTEVFQPGYATVTLYTSSSPYATTAFFAGSGSVGQVVKNNFYDNGNFQGGKYAPGQTIITAVYDGIQGESGSSQARQTIVGFARVTIFGYGNGVNVSGNTPADVSVTGTQNTMYGYIANTNDALQQNMSSFSGGPPKLVK
jgi:hypothetical protein